MAEREVMGVLVAESYWGLLCLPLSELEPGQRGCGES